MLSVPCCTCVHHNPDSFRVGCRGCSHTVCTHCGYEDTSQGPSQYRFFCVHCYEPEWQAVRAGSMGSSEVASSALFLACGGGDPVCCESRRRYICRGYQRWQTRPANVAPKAGRPLCPLQDPSEPDLRLPDACDGPSEGIASDRGRSVRKQLVDPPRSTSTPGASGSCCSRGRSRARGGWCRRRCGGRRLATSSTSRGQSTGFRSCSSGRCDRWRRRGDRRMRGQRRRQAGGPGRCHRRRGCVTGGYGRRKRLRGRCAGSGHSAGSRREALQGSPRRRFWLA